jgi:uncharacterized protein (TIRG00374 family)
VKFGLERVGKRLWRPALIIVLAAVLWRYFAGLDLAQVARQIESGGWLLLLTVLPYGLVFLAESLAWQRTLAGSPAPRLGTLYLIRMATDALLYSIPGGVAVAEPMRPVLLQKHCGIALAEGIGSCIITKITIAIAQVVFILLGFILVTASYPGVTTLLGVGDGLMGAVAIGVPLLCAIGLLVLPFSGPRLTQMARGLARIPVGPIRRAMERVGPMLGRLDDQIGRFVREHPYRFAGALLFSFVAWIVIAAETFLVLRILGAEPTFTQAVALEATASILRIFFFFLPAGIGASEVGFLALFAAFGFPEAITLGAAYITVKRLKEAGWVGLGYLALWFFGVHPVRSKRTGTSPSHTVS